jgi:serine/threonine protein kinase
VPLELIDLLVSYAVGRGWSIADFEPERVVGRGVMVKTVRARDKTVKVREWDLSTNCECKGVPGTGRGMAGRRGIVAVKIMRKAVLRAKHPLARPLQGIRVSGLIEPDPEEIEELSSDTAHSVAAPPGMAAGSPALFAPARTPRPGRHWPLVPTFGVFQDAHRIYMVQPYAAGGELFTQLKARRRFPEDQTRLIVATVVEAIGMLHAMGVVYRCLSPENILMGADGYPRLSGFMLAAPLETETVPTTGRKRCNTFCGNRTAPRPCCPCPSAGL